MSTMDMILADAREAATKGQEEFEIYNDEIIHVLIWQQDLQRKIFTDYETDRFVTDLKSGKSTLYGMKIKIVD